MSARAAVVARFARPALLASLIVAALAALAAGAAPSPARVRELVDGAPVLAPLVFVGLYALLTVLLVPGAVGSAVAGALFGTLAGTLLTVCGATLGAAGAFALARVLGRDTVERFAGPRVRRIDAWLERRGLAGVLFIRLVPLFPFNAVNFAAGLSGVRWRDYVLGTALGIVPGTLALVGLGASLDTPGSGAFWLWLALLVALSAVGALVLRVAPQRPPHPPSAAACRSARRL